ncbi:hypothetical protein ACHAXM_004827 [Skeletonema potamos]
MPALLLLITIAISWEHVLVKGIIGDFGGSWF